MAFAFALAVVAISFYAIGYRLGREDGVASQWVPPMPSIPPAATPPVETNNAIFYPNGFYVVAVAPVVTEDTVPRCPISAIAPVLADVAIPVDISSAFDSTCRFPNSSP